MNNQPITDEEIEALRDILDHGFDAFEEDEEVLENLIAHYQATKDIVKKVRAYQDNPITRHQFAMFDALPPLSTNKEQSDE